MKKESNFESNPDYLFNPVKEFFHSENESAQSKKDIDLNEIRDFNKRFEASHPDEILSWGFEQFGNEMEKDSRESKFKDR